MANWYYVQGSRQQGPVTIEALRQMAAAGQLQPSDMVWTEGMAAWQPAAQADGILPPGVVRPPLPPPGTPIAYAGPAPYLAPQYSLGDDAATRWLLPVGRSGWAIAAGYLGLFSVILFPAPFALVCSIMAIRDIKRHPDRHGMGRAIFGLVMGVIFTIGLCFMLVAITTGPHSRY